MDISVVVVIQDKDHPNLRSGLCWIFDVEAILATQRIILNSYDDSYYEKVTELVRRLDPSVCAPISSYLSNELYLKFSTPVDLFNRLKRDHKEELVKILRSDAALEALDEYDRREEEARRRLPKTIDESIEEFMAPVEKPFVSEVDEKVMKLVTDAFYGYIDYFEPIGMDQD